ncbi:MAG: imidazole glycerol phosphate synthase subunit HisH [Clostridia bacterium]|nr:imidazole glycerol phosphate synthase subunit HisH [Clostridia bacterium]
MVAIVEYGVGNVFSLLSSFAAIGVEAALTSDKAVLSRASHILLPGVGAFGDAADKLRSTGLDRVLVDEAKEGKPLLGICLGMQLLFERSLEYGIHRGLGLLEGDILPLDALIPSAYKIPHTGWNALSFKQESRLFSHIKDGDFVYFVHSYYAACQKECLLATAEYGKDITAAVAKGNVYGCQFHPEKSGEVGLQILRGFAEL